MIYLAGTQVHVYRDDENHPTISGNKLHKLAPNIQLAKDQGCNTILSFGGAFSNHLHALAWACKEQGLASIGVVRGELHHELTPTLRDCQAWGMRLVPIPRHAYRLLQDSLSRLDSGRPALELLPKSITDVPDNTLIIPEGGSNKIAVASLADAYSSVFSLAQYRDITHAVCATGTGATVAGLCQAAPAGIKVIGIQAVAEGEATIKRVRDWLGHDAPQLNILPGHLGGFAKRPTQLLEFIKEFETKFQIPLDPIYNGKVLFKLSEMAQDNYFSEDDSVLVIHTGGLQGNRQGSSS